MKHTLKAAIVAGIFNLNAASFAENIVYKGVTQIQGALEADAFLKSCLNNHFKQPESVLIKMGAQVSEMRVKTHESRNSFDYDLEVILSLEDPAIKKQIETQTLVCGRHSEFLQRK